MPDQRRHRGAHPADETLFAPHTLEALRTASADMSWLLSRGYNDVAALKLVGDHRQLRRRQRVAVRRATASPQQARDRRDKVRKLEGARVLVDGFNQIVGLEAALSGGVVLKGQDRFWRDLSSVHGSYRTVEETEQAIDRLTAALEPAAEVRWLLDGPVSNSGRLAERIRGRGFDVECIDNVDAALIEARDQVVVTCDGPLLDRVAHAGEILPIAAQDLDVWLVDLAPRQ